MRRSIVNILIDFVSLLIMLVLAATGLVMRFTLPPGTGGRGGGLRSTLWGWSRHDWGNLHAWLSVAIGALLVIHLALHWNWICCVSEKLLRREARTARMTGGRMGKLVGMSASVAIAVVLIGFVWFASTQVGNTRTGGPVALARVHIESPDATSASGTPPTQSHAARQRSCSGEHEEKPQAIRGSMTLLDVAATTGVSVELVRANLKLPDSVPLNEKLGRLRRQYGFEISQVRQIVQAQQYSPRADVESCNSSHRGPGAGI